MTLWDMLASLSVSNVVSFGNGVLMVALIQRSFVQDAGILTNEQLLYAFAIARVTPGQANLYVASIGYMMFGFPGAILSIVAIAVPSYMMLPLLRGYRRFKGNPSVFRFTRGLACSASGVILAIAWNLGQESITTVVALTVLALTMALMLLTKLPTLVSLAISTGVGLVAIAAGFAPPLV